MLSSTTRWLLQIAADSTLSTACKGSSFVDGINTRCSAHEQALEGGMRLQCSQAQLKTPIFEINLRNACNKPPSFPTNTPPPEG